MSHARIIVGISGASGAILGIRLLERLRSLEYEIHLIISESAKKTIRLETDFSIEEVIALADVSYDNQDIGARISSGSFATKGMVIVPCSIKSLSAVANSYTADLISRAADVTLKEGRPLLLVVRETPLHLGHIRLMLKAAEIGVIIFPPVPAFYTRTASVDELVMNLVGRILLRFGIENQDYHEWQGG
ncbi:MAG TPA: UbiX family flavin prenyltransferase [Anaerolineae bacterium]|nr:UbiX family flavin prenyltransferase [Anaerolineae bacterium]